MSTNLPKVAFAEADKLEWLELRDTPGFDGTDIPGVRCKFFGREDKGPWAYLVEHAPNVVVERHTHAGSVYHYLLAGEWRLGNRSFGPGFLQYEEEGLFYGPIHSGSDGSLFLAIYDHSPSFIPATSGDPENSADS